MRYTIAETRAFQREIAKPKYRNLYKKIRDYVYPILRLNPFFGNNIKRLKGDYSDLYRYRIGNYRLFYKVVGESVTVFIIGIDDRKNAYR